MTTRAGLEVMEKSKFSASPGNRTPAVQPVACTRMSDKFKRKERGKKKDLTHVCYTLYSFDILLCCHY